MSFPLPTVTFKKHIVSTNFNVSYTLLRFVMVSALLPLFFNLSMSSCSQPDTIAPVSNEMNSAAREDASVLNADGFEGKKIANFWHSELRTPTAGLITNDMHRVGKQAMRFSWKPSQYDGTNPTLHSELLTDALPIGETERWYGYSSYMPSSAMADDDQIAIVSQWHGVPDAGGQHTVPPMCIELKSNRMSLYYAASKVPIAKAMQSPTSTKRIDLGVATYDRWVDYVVHVKWDPTGTTGQLQIWQDGVLKVDEQGISIGYPEQHKPYWKCGLYCWTGKSKYTERAIYYDEVRVGNARANYEVVKPGRNDSSAKARQ